MRLEEESLRPLLDILKCRALKVEIEVEEKLV